MLKKDRLKRKKRIRGKLSGSEKRPRLVVFRSNTTIYAQAVNDDLGKTIAEAHGTDSAEVGTVIAKKLLAAKVKTVVFDRGGYLYHGRVKVLSDAARAGGLIF